MHTRPINFQVARPTAIDAIKEDLEAENKRGASV